MTSVYVIQAEGGPVKIGVARNPHARLAQLRTGTPFRLSLAHVEQVPDGLDAYRIEKAAHALIAPAHVHGEWFSVSAEDAISAVHKVMRGFRAPDRKSIRIPALRPSGAAELRSPPAEDDGLLRPKKSESIRAGRELIGWSQSQLAQAACLPVTMINRLENPRFGPMGSTVFKISALRGAFKAAGVTFHPDGQGERVEFRSRISSPAAAS